MGIMDSVKSRLGFGGVDDGYDDYDDYGDEGYDSDEYGYDASRADDYSDDRGGSYSSDHSSSVRLVSRSSRSHGSSYRSRRGGSGYDSYDLDVQDRDTSEPEFLKNRGSSSSGLGSYHHSNYRPSSSTRRSGAGGYDMPASTGYGTRRNGRYGPYSSSSGSYGSLGTYGSGRPYDSAGSRPSARARRTAAANQEHVEDLLARGGASGMRAGMQQGGGPAGAGGALTIIRPTSYNDAQGVSEAFKSGSPVVLALTDARPELSKRILDFSFGVASALSGRVERLANRVFLITYSTEGLTEAQRRQLRDAGIAID